MSNIGIIRAAYENYENLFRKPTVTLEEIRVTEDDLGLVHCDIYIIGRPFGSDIFYSIGYDTCQDTFMDFYGDASKDSNIKVTDFGSYKYNDIIRILEYRYARYLSIMKETNNNPIIDWKTYKIITGETHNISIINSTEIKIDISRFKSVSV